MKSIDRLIIKAKNLYEPNKEFLVFGTIEHDINTPWKVECMVWDGIKGSGGRTIESTHDTYREAEEAVYEIAEDFPNRNKVKILLIDLETKNE
jgi:hypothetical protein